MATDPAGRREGGPEGPFGALDPKLNIYALANGMDLVKEPASRQLGWYRDGLERAIRMESGADGRLSVTALSWKTNDPATTRRALQREGVTAEELVGELSAVLEAALEAANCL